MRAPVRPWDAASPPFDHPLGELMHWPHSDTKPEREGPTVIFLSSGICSACFQPISCSVTA